MNTACHIHNMAIRSGTKATQYELWKGRKLDVKYFQVFCSKCYIFTYREQIRKMDPINRIMESINFVIDDTLEDKQKDYVSSQQTDVPTDVSGKGSDIKFERTNYEDPQINKRPSIRIH